MNRTAILFALSGAAAVTAVTQFLSYRHAVQTQETAKSVATNLEQIATKPADSAQARLGEVMGLTFFIEKQCPTLKIVDQRLDEIGQQTFPDRSMPRPEFTKAMSANIMRAQDIITRDGTAGYCDAMFSQYGPAGASPLSGIVAKR
jgi:hypothetical protein